MITAHTLAAPARLADLAAELLGPAGQLAVARGGAWVDGRRQSDPDALLPAGARLELRLPPGGAYRDARLDAAAIIYEDAWLLVLEKPAGCYVGPTPWDTRGSLLAAAAALLAARDGAAPPLHLAHQLDRDTSGLLVLSKHPAANPGLQAAFAGGLAHKRYLALCEGAPAWDSRELRSGHGRAAHGRWRLYPAEEVGRELPGGGGRVRLAHSSFAVERRLPGAALVAATLHTGRTHQIRLHLAALGHPLLGDARYGGPAEHAGRPLAGHLLHAAALELPHPIGGARLRLASPTPARFLELLGS